MMRIKKNCFTVENLKSFLCTDSSVIILHYLNVFNVKYVDVNIHEHRQYSTLGGLSAASSYIWD